MVDTRDDECALNTTQWKGKDISFYNWIKENKSLRKSKYLNV